MTGYAGASQYSGTAKEEVGNFLYTRGLGWPTGPLHSLFALPRLVLPNVQDVYIYFNLCIYFSIKLIFHREYSSAYRTSFLVYLPIFSFFLLVRSTPHSNSVGGKSEAEIMTWQLRKRGIYIFSFFLVSLFCYSALRHRASPPVQQEGHLCSNNSFFLFGWELVAFTLSFFFFVFFSAHHDNFGNTMTSHWTTATLYAHLSLFLASFNYPHPMNGYSNIRFFGGERKGDCLSLSTERERWDCTSHVLSDATPVQLNIYIYIWIYIFDLSVTIFF